MALSHSCYKLSLVFNFSVPRIVCEDPLSLKNVIFPLASVDFSIIPSADAISFHLISFPLSCVEHAIIAYIFALAVFQSFNKFAIIASSISPVNFAFAVVDAILEFTFVIVPIFIGKSPVTMILAIFPHAVIF